MKFCALQLLRCSVAIDINHSTKSQYIQIIVLQVVTRELGVDGLKEVTSTPGLVIPVVAIGGIAGEERIKACLQDGGAQGIAVVSAIFGERDVQGATATLRALVARAVPPTSM